MELIQKIKTMLSPSERLLYNITYFLGVICGIKTAQTINARLIATATQRSNIKISVKDFDETIFSLQKKQNNLSKSINKQYE